MNLYFDYLNQPNYFPAPTGHKINFGITLEELFSVKPNNTTLTTNFHPFQAELQNRATSKTYFDHPLVSHYQTSLFSGPSLNDSILGLFNNSKNSIENYKNVFNDNNTKELDFKDPAATDKKNDFELGDVNKDGKLQECEKKLLDYYIENIDNQSDGKVEKHEVDMFKKAVEKDRDKVEKELKELHESKEYQKEKVVNNLT